MDDPSAEMFRIADREQEKIRNAAVEWAVLVVGEQVLHRRGHPTGVEIPAEFDDLVRGSDERGILIHNHPLGGPPSAEDFNVAHELMVFESRVVGVGFTWTLREADRCQWWQMAERLNANKTREKLRAMQAHAEFPSDQAAGARRLTELLATDLLTLFPHLRRDPPP